MKNILVIFKKELKRFFFDRRMLIAMFLPGILIFVLYTLMGKLMNSNIFSTSVENVTYKIAYTNNYSNDTNELPLLLQNLDTYLDLEKKNNKAEYASIDVDKVDEYTQKLKNKEIDLLITFTDFFDDEVSHENENNNITILYNGETNASSNIYQIVCNFVQSSYNNYTQNIDLTTHSVVNPDVGTKNALLNKIIGFILPMVTVSLLYASISSFCPESISGEKERGTLASMLLTPIKRSEFVLGKILALSIVAVASGIVSFIGLIASLPSMMGFASIPLSISEILLLLLIMIATLIFFVSFGVLISSVSNSVKEAGTYLGPFSALFMVIAMVPAISGMNNIGFAFIPVINFSMCISNMLNSSGNLSLLFVITFISNIIYSVFFIYLVTRLFKKESVILGH